MEKLGIIEETEKFAEDGLSGGSEDEDDSTQDVDDVSHRKLLSSVQAMDKTTGRLDTERRTEPAQKVSDFHVITSGSKVQLHHLIGELHETTKHGALKTQLRSVARNQKVLSAPVPTVHKDKLERSVAYESTKKDVSKWQPVIYKNRQADQLIFPLEKPNVPITTTTNDFVKKFQPRTSLEMEVAALLHGNKAVLSNDSELTPMEEEALKAMSLEEARERRAELQKHRMLLSYEATKSRRQKKIKSRKYHRILKKERLKKQEKALNTMKETDPEAYNAEVEKVDKQRIMERMSQKHRGASKFMKKQIMYGKYDERARQSVQDMLQKGRDLKEKVRGVSSSEGAESEREELGEEEGPGGGVTVHAESNPWMKAALTQHANNKPQPVVSQEKIDQSDSESETDAPPSDSVQPMRDEGEEEKSGTDSESAQSDVDLDDLFDAVSNVADVEKKHRKSLAQKQSEGPAKKKILLDNAKASKDSKKNRKKPETPDKDSKQDDNDLEEDEEEETAMLTEGMKRKRTLDDFGGDYWVNGKSKKRKRAAAEEEDSEDLVKSKSKKTKFAAAKKKSEEAAKEVHVDPEKLVTLEREVRGSGEGVSVAVDEEGEEDQQRMTIAEAFASDDVLEEFQEEKRSLEERDAPKTLDFTLPGWGSWGGSGLEVSKKKRERFMIKPPTQPPRKDSGLKNVIISETKDTSIAKYQVNEVPHPYSNIHVFENTIKQPIGKTWVPETAFHNLVQPKVVTKLGKIIEPIDKGHTFKKKTATEEFSTTTKKQKPGKSKNKKKE